MRKSCGCVIPKRGGEVAKHEHLKNATAQLEAVAVQDRPEHLVYLRVASSDDKVYIDLGDADRNIVEVAADGWKDRSVCSGSVSSAAKHVAARDAGDRRLDQ
jgi:hypothetical protein